MIYNFPKQNAHSVCMVGDRAFFYGDGGIFRVEPDNTIKEVFGLTVLEVLSSGTRALARTTEGVIYVSDDYGETWKTSGKTFVPSEFKIVAGNDGSFIAYKEPPEIATNMEAGTITATTDDTLYGTTNGVDWVHRTTSKTVSGNASYNGIFYNVVFDGRDFIFHETFNDNAAVSYSYYKLSITATGVSEESLFTTANSFSAHYLKPTNNGLFLYSRSISYNGDYDFAHINIESHVAFAPKNDSGEYDFSKITSRTTSTATDFNGRLNNYFITGEQACGVYYTFASDSLVAHVPQDDGTLLAIPFFTFADYSVNYRDYAFEIFNIRDDLSMLIVCNATDKTRTVGMYSIYWQNKTSAPKITKQNSAYSPRKFLGASLPSWYAVMSRPLTLNAVASPDPNSDWTYYAFLASDVSDEIILYHIASSGDLINEVPVQGDYNDGERIGGTKICLGEDKLSYYLVSDSGECQYYQAFPNSKTEDEFVFFHRDEENYISATVKTSNPSKTIRKGLVFNLNSALTLSYGGTAKAEATFNTAGNCSSISTTVKTTEGVSETSNYVYHGQSYSNFKFAAHDLGGFLNAPSFDFYIYCAIQSTAYSKYEFALDGIKKLEGTWHASKYSKVITLSLSEDEWNTLDHGDHVLTLTTYACRKDAESEAAAVVNPLTETVETYTFKKVTDKIAFITKTLDGSKGTRPLQFACAIHASLISGQTTVYACNNAYDASPTWEDITQYVGATASAYTFQNTTKTADKWGVAIKFEANNAAADGSVWISSMSGGFTEESL